MNPLVRLAAAALLALMLPIQGFAAACAQICAAVEQQRHAQAMAAMSESAGGEGDAGHCGDSSTLGASKCCQAHAFMVDALVPAVHALPACVEAAHFVARWTSFIPEEPSPPPISTVSFA